MSSYSKHNERRNSLKHHQTNIIKINEEENKNKWTVMSSDSDNEDVNDGKQLTTLVRKSYTKHLKDTLAKNIAEWKKTVESIDSIHNIERWVSILEQKALRSCMVAELYQKTMIHMISDIKKCTQQSKLFLNLELSTKMMKFLPLDKGTQSEIEDRKVKKFNVETQTGKSYSLLDLPLPLSELNYTSPVIRGQPIPTIDQIRDCVAKVTPVPRSSNLLPQAEAYTTQNIFTINKNEQILNSNMNMIPVSNLLSDLNAQEINFDNKQNICTFPNKTGLLLNGTLHNDILEDLQSEFSTEKKIFTETNFIENSMNKNNNNKSLDCKNIKNLKRKTNMVKDINSTKNKVLKKSIDLDARLAAMGLLSDNYKDEISIDVKKKSNWHLEWIAQSCNLSKIMLSFSIKKKNKILNKFKVLFGIPYDHDTELSDENIKVCRKRIASVVVAELTPLYQEKRIGSRHLFKYLAKHATDALLKKSYAPESCDIRKLVQDIFMEQKDNESGADIFI